MNKKDRKKRRKRFWQDFWKILYEKFLVWFISIEIGLFLITVGLVYSKAFSTTAISIGVALIVVVPFVIYFVNRKRYIKK